MMAKPVRVLVCDDDQHLRETVAEHWRAESRVEVVGEAADGVETVSAAARLQPDVVLLGWYMPRLTGVGAAPHLKRMVPHAALVMWSSDASPTAAATAEAVGVDRFLAKTVMFEELTACVLDAAASKASAVTTATVLLAHPSSDWRVQARATLDLVGADIHEAASGEEATDIWRTHQPGVVMIDKTLVHQMPLDELGAKISSTSTAMIVVDGALGLEEALAALDSGINDHLLIEPVSAPELASRFQAASETSRLREQVLSVATHVAQLAELARTDELTGLANRRAIADQLKSLTSTARRHHRKLSVALVDIDLFKAINDSHGHLAGDEVLGEVGRRLLARAREEDVVARRGGDEFLVLLPETDRSGAAAAAEALRAAIEHQPMPVGDEEIAITVSVGWAAWHGEEDEELLDRADVALYTAKRAGRNRTAEAVPVA